MTEDATAQLIDRIMSQLTQDDPNAASAQQYQVDFVGSLDTAFGVAANYAQVLSTVLAAGAVTSGAGAAVVVLISVLMAALSVLTEPASTSDPALEQLLYSVVLDTQGTSLDGYWQGKWMALSALWLPVHDNLGYVAHEGFGQWRKGPSNSDVTEYEDQFFGDAYAFVNAFVPSENLPPAALDYWQRPYVEVLQYSAQLVPYGPNQTEVAGVIGGWSMGWYGAQPIPQTSSTQGVGQVPDPSTMLPYFLLAINSLLTFTMLLNQIDPSQPTYGQYLEEYNSDITNYADWLYTQYQTAVLGLVKSDIPTVEDVMGFLAGYDGGSLWSTLQGKLGGSPLGATSPLGSVPTAGYTWNGVYGVADQYGYYPQIHSGAPGGGDTVYWSVNVPSSSPSCIIEYIDMAATDAAALIDVPGDLLPATAANLTYPWLADKLLLGLMARWKALYLISGYDEVWAVLQKLGTLPGLTPYPMLSLPDGTVADAHWSVRELIDVLGRNTSNWFPVSAPLAETAEGNYSLFLLAQCLDEVANGNWAGPATAESAANQPARPVGVRDRLAAAAV